MAEIRFNYGDKFTQTTDTNTGIGSTIPAVKLDVAGGASAGSLRVSGIATLSSYQGFVNTKLSTTEDLIVEAGQSGSVSGEVVIGTGQTISVSTGATTGQGGIQSLKVYETFMPPVGGTADRPTDVKPGMVYYNKDFKTIEFWDGNFWKQVDNTTRRGRGLFAGGRTPSFPNSIEFIEISSLGNAKNFGDLTEARESATNGVASHVRGLFGGGYHPGAGDDEIDYVTMASEGNAIDFGNLSAERYSPGGGSSSTRGIFGGGHPSVNIIEYVEINTLGNAVDFGDLVTARRYPFGTSSPVRVVFAGGTTSSSPYPPLNVMDFITTSSKGDATTFGVLSAAVQFATGCSNSVRGLYHLGTNSWSPTWVSLNQVDIITLASTGNATNFGELTDPRHYTGGVSNNVRGVFGGGFTGPNTTRKNTIDFVLISSQGNGQDFGDLIESRTAPGTVCDSHGGLGGF